jgi:hypothetical protein
MKNAALVLSAALLLAACSRQDGEGGFTLGVTTGQATPDGQLAAHDLRLTTAHLGQRRLEFAPGSGPGFSFREEILTDGHGHYRIRPIDSDSSTLDWDSFEMMQVLHEGFLFRYRDLVVRDERLLARNWDVIDLGRTVDIAGRTCRTLRVVRKRGERVAFELAVDRDTRLVLASRRFDGQGDLRASMRYESLELEPDTAGVDWHEASNDEQPLALLDLGLQLDQRVLEPRLLPDGYALHEAATVSDGATRWLKLTYTDGIEPLFFFQKLEQPDAPGAVARRPGSNFGAPPAETSQVTIYQVEHVAVAQGRVNGFDLMAMGAVSEGELLDLIESSLP